jgi:mpaB/rubber oxygenase-like protein
MPTTMTKPRWARNEIAALDPVVDNERIMHLSAEVRYGDPVLAAVLFTVGFARTMAVPSIAAVVHRGGRAPIMTESRKRNDDTLVFFGEFLRHGHSTPEGHAAIDRLEEIHAPFPIRNDERLYTLASLSFDAVRIPALLGLDPMTPNEKEAAFHFWQGVGRRMGVTDMPATRAECEAWMYEYEREHWGWSPGGEAVTRALIDDFSARWLPTGLQRVAHELIPALMEDEMCDVLHLKRPKARTRALARVLGRAYFTGRRILPDPKDRFWTHSFGAEYGGCPRMADLGYMPERDRPAPPAGGCPVTTG